MRQKIQLPRFFSTATVTLKRNNFVKNPDSASKKISQTDDFNHILWQTYNNLVKDFKISIVQLESLHKKRTLHDNSISCILKYGREVIKEDNF